MSLTTVLFLSRPILVLMLQMVSLSVSIMTLWRQLVPFPFLLVSLLNSGSRMSLWLFCFIKWQPSSSLEGSTPYRHLFYDPLSCIHIRCFSCVCYALLPHRERTKLTTQSVECVFLGYNTKHKVYIVAMILLLSDEDFSMSLLMNPIVIIIIPPPAHIAPLCPSRSLLYLIFLFP